MDLLALKLLFLALCFMITACLGSTPIVLFEYFKNRVQDKRWFKLLMAALTCFSGGIFLAVCFLHLLPETRMHFLQATNTGHLFGDHNQLKGKRIPLKSLDDGVYPYPELIAVVGFFCIYLIESSVVYFMIGNDPSIDVLIAGGESMEAAIQSQPDYGTTTANSTPVSQKRHKQKKQNSKERLLKTWDDVQTITLIIALSVNSMIEGLALGISLDRTHLAIRFIGVMSHKSLVAFITGLQCARSSLGRSRALSSILFYSFMTPLGLALGTLLTEAEGLEQQESVRNYLIVILEGLSSGTFLYVTFFEILSRVREAKTSSLLFQVAWTMLGFAPMAGLICLTI